MQTGDQRPSERNMSHFLFSDPIKKEMEAACINVCTLENAKEKHVHTQGISVRLKDRDGDIWFPPTDGYRAPGREQVWTAM